MVGHPKLRINVPKSPAATTTMMQKNFHFYFKDKAIASDIENVSLMAKPKTSLGSVFSSLLGNKRLSVPKCPIKGKKNGKERHDVAAMALQNEFEPKPDVTALSQLLLLEQALENGQRGEGKHSRMDKQRLKILLGFLEKRKELNSFITSKWRASKNNLYAVVARFGQVRRNVSSGHLIKIPSKFVVIGFKLKMIRSLGKKKVTQQFKEESDEDNDRELCKKRILMGQRCRPLFSPSPRYLSYDQDRFLLPKITS
ncbi:unnamed protein product [Vicia faba]|uniref:Uncharacterized protein n=1 Tax=Vicia faba TaxID=3906 RepID=A0AAV0ZYS2_VICFA|nr:unnamed protein product [Vicia faba]